MKSWDSRLTKASSDKTIPFFTRHCTVTDIFRFWLKDDRGSIDLRFLRFLHRWYSRRRMNLTSNGAYRFTCLHSITKSAYFSFSLIRPTIKRATFFYHFFFFSSTILYWFSCIVVNNIIIAILTSIIDYFSFPFFTIIFFYYFFILFIVPLSC